MSFQENFSQNQFYSAKERKKFHKKFVTVEIPEYLYVRILGGMSKINSLTKYI